MAWTTTWGKGFPAQWPRPPLARPVGCFWVFQGQASFTTQKKKGQKKTKKNSRIELQLERHPCGPPSLPEVTVSESKFG
jgi:hypothetical protein